MKPHVKILNSNLEPIAILENAYAIGYERNINDLWNMGFSLPLDDDKNKHCKPFNFVELTDVDGEYIGLFRIVPAKTRKLATINEVNYELEHVLATLLNDILFQYHQRSNYTTRSNIEYILSQQTVKHWRLGVCDFERYFHYKWENENGLLGALFSIAEPFDEPYVWTWDTQTYPWTLNLVKPESTPTAEIRYGKNLAEIEREIDPSNIVNRIYPLGGGEGVNQLNIREINGGLPYLEDSASIAEYGLQSYVWVDRRFEDVDSLYASAQAFLDKWSVPRVSYRIKAVDLSSITGLTIDKFTVGKIVRINDPEIGVFNARIVGEDKPNMLEQPYDIELTLSNKADGIGTTLADIERRQEINEVYAQGATNILSFNYQDNCDANIPAVIPFYVDDDVVNVNTIELTYRTKKFRAYSQATEGGGSLVKSTKGGGGTTRSTTSGGGTTATSSSGGGTSTSTQSGGGSSQTSAAGGDHRHKIGEVTTGVIRDSDGPVWTGGRFGSSVTSVRMGAGNASGSYTFIHTPGEYSGTPFSLWTEGSSGSHSHSVTIPTHSHSFSTPNHTHSVNIPNHSHEVTIPTHTHEIELPDHTHDVKHAIVELDTVPTRLTIKVDGNTVPHTAISGNRVDLIPYLQKDSSGKVTRGQHEVTISPNGLARIEADLIMRVFVQSQLGGNY